MANILKRVGYGSSGGGGSSGNVQEPVADPSSLPLTGNTVDDLRYVISEETFYRWNGSAWIPQNANTLKYQDTFVFADWVSNSGEYWIEYPSGAHNKGNSPIVTVYELDAGQYSSVILTIEVTNSGTVRLRVPQSPDLRFDGKIIIA